MTLAILIDSVAATLRAGTGLPPTIALRTAVSLALLVVAVAAMPEALRRSGEEYEAEVADRYAA